MNQQNSSITLILIIIISILVLMPSMHTTPLPSIEPLRETKQLNLLRVEHYLELEATENVQAFHVNYVFPPDYGYQVPIVLEIHNDTTSALLDYRIQDDCYQPNHRINFSLSSMDQGEHTLLHFSTWTLVETHDFSDAPKDTNIPPSSWQNPPETQQWLSSSEVVQKNRLRIKATAHRLRHPNDSIYEYAQNISSFIFHHRHTLFLIQLWTNSFLSQDALTTLLIGGENVGRGHLACALFRSQNIPARMLLVHNDQGFWTQMHYMVEYYIPDYGWVLLDPTYGKTPYSTHKQVINRICSIEDEQDTKHDFIYRFMKGLERWIWIDTENVTPYYVNCDEGSKSLMYTEAVLELPTFAADFTFFRTQNVFTQYKKYMNKQLNNSDQFLLNQAITNQIDACNQLINTTDINEYIFHLEKAYDAYKQIQA